MRERLSRLLLVLVRYLLWPFRQGGRVLSWVSHKLRQGLASGGRLLWRRLGRPLWQLAGRIGLALRHLLARLLALILGRPARFLWRRIVRPLWIFVGRTGLALRNLLAWIIWRPTHFLWRRVIRPVWAFIGRMGLAFRNILDRLLWRPLLFITTPWRLLYRRFLHRPLMRALAFLLRIPLGILHRVRRALSARWHAGQGTREYWKRHFRSQVRVARAHLRLRLQRPQPPPRAVTAPVMPRTGAAPSRYRTTRLLTTALALSLVVIASFFTAQQAPELGHVGANEAGANSNYPLISSKFTAKPTTTPVPSPPPATATPVASPTPWPTPDPLNSGGSVAFTLRQQGNNDIYALSIGQSQPVRLTNDPAADRDPAWSPDGRQLAFASHRDGNWELYLLDLPDGTLRRLTDDPAFDGGPAWSPDGQWLVFESYRAGNLDIYILDIEGDQGPIRLTKNPAPDFSPAWSPDGRHIAFTSWRTGNKDIFILSLDAAADDQARNVTGTPDHHEDHPAFSPAGDRLAYADDSTGFALVYTLPIAGSNPTGDPVSHGQGHQPSWSPDGKALTYVHSSAGQSHLIAGSLDAWSVAPQAFTTNTHLEDPDWSARTLPRTLPEHLQAINEASSQPLFTERVTEPQSEGPPNLLQELPVNAPAPYLSDRVDDSFRALRQAVQEAGGWDFLGQLAQMYEPLTAKPLPGQSNRTWNKAGRAFDYDTAYVLAFDPQVEVVREDTESATYWRTYLRAAAQDGSQGEPLRDLPWDFRARYGPESQYYDQGGKWKEQIPAGYYLDFTSLAADFGWQRVPTADNWRTYFPGARFWHYENRQGLPWEPAMLELYTAQELLDAFR